MNHTLPLLLLLAAPPRHHRHYRDEHIRNPMPTLRVMKARFDWVKAQNKAEHYPRWRFTKPRR